MSYTYKYPRPAVCVDCVIFSHDRSCILLIKRANEPFKESWALPGGFIEMDETLEESAKRELEEEAGLKNITLKQFYAYGNPGRDPRGRVISIAFWGVLDVPESPVCAGSDAKKAKWFHMKKLPSLAFDHSEIISNALTMVFHA